MNSLLLLQIILRKIYSSITVTSCDKDSNRTMAKVRGLQFVTKNISPLMLSIVKYYSHIILSEII